MISGGTEFVSQLNVVIDLAVANGSYLTVRCCYRLVACFEINDGKAAHCQKDPRIKEETRVIWTSMVEKIQCLHNCSTAWEIC